MLNRYANGAREKRQERQEHRGARTPLAQRLNVTTAKDGKPVLPFNKSKRDYERIVGSAPWKPNAKVKIGTPHFVDFGKNMEHSPEMSGGTGKT